jgi:hypothetical protein
MSDRERPPVASIMGTMWARASYLFESVRLVLPLDYNEPSGQASNVSLSLARPMRSAGSARMTGSSPRWPARPSSCGDTSGRLIDRFGVNPVRPGCWLGVDAQRAYVSVRSDAPEGVVIVRQFVRQPAGLVQATDRAFEL